MIYMHLCVEHDAKKFPQFGNIFGVNWWNFFVILESKWMYLEYSYSKASGPTLRETWWRPVERYRHFLIFCSIMHMKELIFPQRDFVTAVWSHMVENNPSKMLKSCFWKKIFQLYYSEFGMHNCDLWQL